LRGNDAACHLKAGCKSCGKASLPVLLVASQDYGQQQLEEELALLDKAEMSLYPTERVWYR
jgi:hypothetical protein